MGGHPEAVRDGIRERLPFPGKGLVEEPEDGPGELARVRVEPVTPHVAVHDAPRTPDRVGCGA